MLKLYAGPLLLWIVGMKGTLELMPLGPRWSQPISLDWVENVFDRRDNWAEGQKCREMGGAATSTMPGKTCYPSTGSSLKVRSLGLIEPMGVTTVVNNGDINMSSIRNAIHHRTSRNCSWSVFM